jgi:hypothetical protein
VNPGVKPIGGPKDESPVVSAGSPAVNGSALTYYIHDHSQSFRLQLIGTLSEPFLPGLKGCWLTAASSRSGRGTCIDICRLTSADENGVTWLSELARLPGVEFIVTAGYPEQLAQTLNLPNRYFGTQRTRQSWLYRIRAWFSSHRSPVLPRRGRS